MGGWCTLSAYYVGPRVLRRHRVESSETLGRLKTWGFIVAPESSLGSQILSERPSSPAFRIPKEPRLTHATTSGPRGLMGYDHRPLTEYKYDVPGSMSKQVESTRATSPDFQFGRCGVYIRCFLGRNPSLRLPHAPRLLLFCE